MVGTWQEGMMVESVVSKTSVHDAELIEQLRLAPLRSKINYWLQWMELKDLGVWL